MPENLNWNDFTGNLEDETPGIVSRDLTEDDRDDKKLFYDLFIEQTQEFKYIGDDLINNYQVYEYEIFYEFLEYIDDNVLKINDIDIILNDIETTVRIGYFIYQILYIDLIYKYIPRLLQKEGQKTFEYIISLEYTELRDKILDLLMDKSELLNIGNSKSTPALDLEKLKISISMELFNNDLEDFCENFLYNILGELNEFDLKII